MEQTFWMVWNPARNAPTCKHESLDSAEREAKRLARINPDEQFFVLESVSGWVKSDVQRIDLDPAIPF